MGHSPLGSTSMTNLPSSIRGKLTQYFRRGQGLKDKLLIIKFYANILKRTSSLVYSLFFLKKNFVFNYAACVTLFVYLKITNWQIFPFSFLFFLKSFIIIFWNVQFLSLVKYFIIAFFLILPYCKSWLHSMVKVVENIILHIFKSDF
jgi:hypothetical protein